MEPDHDEGDEPFERVQDRVEEVVDGAVLQLSGAGAGAPESSAVTRGGTWSTPPGFHGLQRTSRRTVSQLPLNNPKRFSAVMAYAEQQGANRQLGGSKGEIRIW